MEYTLRPSLLGRRQLAAPRPCCEEARGKIGGKRGGEKPRTHHFLGIVTLLFLSSDQPFAVATPYHPVSAPRCSQRARSLR